MELVKALRAALDDQPVAKQPLQSIPEGPGDKSQADSSISEDKNKSENAMKKQRRKMP